MKERIGTSAPKSPETQQVISGGAGLRPPGDPPDAQAIHFQFSQCTEYRTRRVVGPSSPGRRGAATARRALPTL